jgi:hypothetical protein
VDEIDSGAVYRSYAAQAPGHQVLDKYRAYMEREARERYRVLDAFPIERLAAIGMIDMVLPVRRAMHELEVQFTYYTFDAGGLPSGATASEFDQIRRMVEQAWAGAQSLPPPP